MPPLIGVFGGTFDPPHLGHLALASAARAQLGLDRLLWMLTPDPPHKQGEVITPIEHRLAMVELALAGHPEFELSRLELDRPGPHYALDTVKLLAEQNPRAGIVYLMGGDSLRGLPTWRRPADLLSALRFVGVMRRPASSPDLPALERILPGITAKVRFVDAPPVDISASGIRSLAAAGKEYRQFVLPAVYDYIVEHGLYFRP
ncbi:MAG: nicotinate-nucleotide adenylyltransferase [Anaerolineaceae bacterium]|nr:MAG: nicotinate-nucleotide adenylyltransferase [Anaerolineaceae bacterium]